MKDYTRNLDKILSTDFENNVSHFYYSQYELIASIIFIYMAFQKRFSNSA